METYESEAITIIGKVILSSGETMGGNEYLSRVRTGLDKIEDKNSNWYRERNELWHIKKNILKRGIDLKCYNLVEEGKKEIRYKYYNNLLTPFLHNFYEFCHGKP